MCACRTTLLGRTKVAEGTMAFQFEKPTDFVFKPGQYIDLAISDSQRGSANGLTHTFSIASSCSNHNQNAKYSFQTGLIRPADWQHRED
jgi:ferredoxin-NADP reductase